ncbi:MAG: B12-binding domain-containing radical SAM protein [Bacteroidales bacterium]|nr:B12-binding domain-containing radical SAM protein [Bacteroidales bacterium]
MKGFKTLPEIVLIKPPIPYHMAPSEQQPLGIAYIASQTRKKGYQVSLADLGELELNDNSIEKIPYGDIYGLTASFLDLKASHYIATQLRKRNPQSKIIIGGPGPTSLPELIDFNIFNSMILGEGENAFIDLIEDFQDSGIMKSQYSASFIHNLDNIPFPARDLFRVKGGRIFSFGAYYGSDRSTGLITSRGCPYDCAYCSTNAMWERKVRFRSAENVVDEIDECINKHNIRQFRVQDDNFTLKKERVEKICNEILNRKLNIYWRCSTASSLVDKELLKLMNRAGCMEISYGAESGDPDVLRLMNRKQDPETIAQSIEKAHQAGIKVRLFFMVGLPGTSQKTAERDIEFLKKAKPDALNLAVYTPYPGSDIWNNPGKYGVTINTKNFDYYNMHLFSGENRSIDSVISSNTIDKKTLEIQKKTVIDFADKKGIIHKS